MTIEKLFLVTWLVFLGQYVVVDTFLDYHILDLVEMCVFVIILTVTLLWLSGKLMRPSER